MKKKLKTGTIILIVACFIGVCALLYPTVANYWNENYTTQAVTSYVHSVEQFSEEDYQKFWQEAITYNQELFQSSDGNSFYENYSEEYWSALNPNGTGVMGYIEIPKIDVSLPVYHGTSAEVLQTSIGHLEWTSLPVGGENTHCVVSGHRGLPSAKLFTDLDALREGDQFTLTILNEVLTYEVDQIRTVLPTDLSDLQIKEGKDYCTLVTCTPYGINTHRLLVRGHRIENEEAPLHLISEAVIIDQLIVATILAIPILLILFMMVMLKKPEKKVDPMLQLAELVNEAPAAKRKHRAK